MTRETVFAVLDAREGKDADLARAIQRLAPEVRAERGCVEFTPARSTSHEGRFYIYEVYASADAFEQHLHTPHVQRFIASLDPITTDGRTAADRTTPLDLDHKEQA